LNFELWLAAANLGRGGPNMGGQCGPLHAVFARGLCRRDVACSVRDDPTAYEMNPGSG
jgi:hypothetical protein